MATIRLLRGLLLVACLPAVARAPPPPCTIPRACASAGAADNNDQWYLIMPVSQITCVSWSVTSGLAPTYNYVPANGNCFVQDCTGLLNIAIMTGYPFMCQRFTTCTKAVPPKLLGKCPPGSQPTVKGANMACCCSSAPYALVDSNLSFKGCLKTSPWIFSGA